MASQQHPVEVIMARGFTSNLATPAFVVDDTGRLIFYNEAAGELLGVRFEEAGPMEQAEWGARFEPSSLEGGPLKPDELPLTTALQEVRPAHSSLMIRLQNGEMHQIEVTAFPIVGRSGSHGAIGIFWDQSA
ncbi:MAG: hypothetical protein NVSMB51_08080 [Solirubrobacteraceae bacterium]